MLEVKKKKVKAPVIRKYFRINPIEISADNGHGCEYVEHIYFHSQLYQ